MSAWDKDAPRSWFVIVQGTAITSTFETIPSARQLDDLTDYSPSGTVRVETWEGGTVISAIMYKKGRGW